MIPVFPDVLTILLFISFGILITVIGFLFPKRIGVVTEIILAISVLAYLFLVFPFSEAVMLMSFSAMAYGHIGTLLDENKRKKRDELKQKLLVSDYQIIGQKKAYKRILVDVLLTVFVSAGAIIFLFFAPTTYALLKFIISFGLIAILAQMIERAGNFFTTKLYWLPNEEKLIILLTFQSRDFPMDDIKEIKRESAPDLLHIHPLFTFLSSNQDYTSSFQAVLRLSFPGENIYLTPDGITRWENVFRMYITEAEDKQVKKVLPLWHPKILKRLIWKGYFAITVKGVSAYTGLIFILIWLDVPAYVMIGFVLVWWLFNLYVSDRVLIAGTDAVEITDGEIFDRARRIFEKAGIPNTKLYRIDSPIYNGMATGMNIGRGTVMLTKATMELPVSAVEAILAHEAIHIKKRDVLTTQIARMAFFGLIAVGVYLLYDQIVLLTERLFIFIPVFYILMILFPIYLSIIGQWTEVRADHLGARILEGGREQMKNGLREVGNAQDKELHKSVEYSQVKEKKQKDKPSTERGIWILRLIEFQLLMHPPLYWRITCLSHPFSWQEARKAWMIARMKESLSRTNH